MNDISTLRITNYLIAVIVIFFGIVFSVINKNFLPFLVGFTGAALIITLYKNTTWDFRERIGYFKNYLKEIKKIYCPACGSYNPWWSNYCVNCGDEIPQQETECQICHSLNPPLSTYCGVCGEELEQQEVKKKPEQTTSKVEETIEANSNKRKCPNCGYEFSLDVGKCPWCGNKL